MKALDYYARKKIIKYHHNKESKDIITKAPDIISTIILKCWVSHALGLKHFMLERLFTLCLIVP